MAGERTIVPKKMVWYVCVAAPSEKAKDWTSYPKDAKTPQTAYIAYLMTDSERRQVQKWDSIIRDDSASSKERHEAYEKRSDFLMGIRSTNDKELVEKGGGVQRYVAFFAGKDQLCNGEDDYFYGQWLEVRSPARFPMSTIDIGGKGDNLKRVFDPGSNHAASLSTLASEGIAFDRMMGAEKKKAVL